MLDVDEVVAHYIMLRDRKDAIAAKHKEELEPLNRDMQDIELALAAVMQELGVDSLKTPHGTPYFAETASVKVVDWEAALAYVRDNDRFDLLERRLSKTAVVESASDMPGIAISREKHVNIRRKS